MGEHQIALSVVWVRAVQKYALHKTDVHASVTFCACVCVYVQIVLSFSNYFPCN